MCPLLDLLACLILSLIMSFNIPATFLSLMPMLQRIFYINLTIDSFISLISSRYFLNKKQHTVTYILLDRILKPLLIQTVDDQLLLYFSSVSGLGKTHLIKVFIFRLSILEKQDNILLTASTGAAAININGSTYYFALALYGN